MNFLPIYKKGFIFLFVAISFFAFVKNANAQGTNHDLNTNPDVPQNFHSYTQSVILELAAALSCQLTGIDPLGKENKCLGIDQKTGKIGFVQNSGGLIGMSGNLIAMSFNIPVSSGQYVRHLASNFGVGEKVYAQEQGAGFQGLSPLLPLWKAFRNIVYLFFVLIFIIIGLGIMFRVKIDPRTVMTIQNQIPKIIIALILVTFSYAIAGFLIDLMYLSLYLIFNVFASVNANIDPNYLAPDKILGSNPLKAVGALGGLGIAFDASRGIGGLIGSLFDGTTGTVIAGIIGAIIGGLIAGVTAGFSFGLSFLIGPAAGLGIGLLGGGKAIGFIGGIIAFLIISVAIVTALFRLWLALIKAYIFILIKVVFAPFFIAGGLIPGSTKNFQNWLRDIVGDLAAFPTTLVMLLLGSFFIDAFGKGANETTFTPPFIGNPGDPEMLGALIALGIILLTPQVVTIVRSTIKAPEGKLGSSIGQSIGAGAGIAGSPAASAWKRLTREAGPYGPSGVLRQRFETSTKKVARSIPGVGKIIDRITPNKEEG